MDDIEHLILGADKTATVVAGIACRPITLQSYALLEMTGNEILAGENAKFSDILSFIYLHSAPESEIASIVSAYVGGDKSKLLQATLALPAIPLSDVKQVADDVRRMLEKAMGGKYTVEGQESVSGN